MEETIEHKGNQPTPSTTRVPHYENSSAPLSPPQKHDPIDRPQATNLMSTRIATQNAQRKTSTTESNARRPSEGKNNLDIRREKTPHHKKNKSGVLPRAFWGPRSRPVCRREKRSANIKKPSDGNQCLGNQYKVERDCAWRHVNIGPTQRAPDGKRAPLPRWSEQDLPPSTDGGILETVQLTSHDR